VNEENAKDACHQRQAGVLLHLTSLPGDRGGNLGADAYRFVDFLVAAGFRVWQMLPVNPVGVDGSPYQSNSAFAGNADLIDVDYLMAQGWLEDVQGDLCQSVWAAWQGFCRMARPDEMSDFADFIARQTYWLEDFVLYKALHQEFDLPWWAWPQELRDRDEKAMDLARARFADQLTCFRFEQYLFFRQWRGLKAYANERGVRLFGDIPIFVAHDSAEVWSRPHLFELDEEGQPTLVAGVPPDYFSATGQRWGNPLYRWDVMLLDDYAFWEHRIKTQHELFDLIRIDHFRGFESYWAIPASEEVAINGTWMPGPGEAFFQRLHEKLGPVDLVAEDLGVITDEVRALKKALGLPGMKILQFAFSRDADNPYLPYNHEPCSVVYTGTHDNDTTLGWYQSLDSGDRGWVDDYLGQPSETMPWPLIRQALGSRSQLAVLPMQDLLGLDGTHRMNMPGTVEGNWSWCFQWVEMPADLVDRLRHLLGLYGRLG
jgi:4-alpha-glucanotransferase